LAEFLRRDHDAIKRSITFACELHVPVLEDEFKGIAARISANPIRLKHGI